MITIRKLYSFYKEGFTHMPSWAKQAWLVILIKLFVMFIILKLFFFPNFLKTKFHTDQERSNHVLENLTNINK
jgi:predicted lactoylglutathione lyase